VPLVARPWLPSPPEKPVVLVPAAGVPRNARRAQFPDLELAAQLLTGCRHAQCLLDEATELTSRLPLTLGGMVAGLIDAVQPEPGGIRWTLPSGRTGVTRPTTYVC
jgi:hypothetical protein